ncbi:O-antigen ligase family protein [Sphingomonas koreensis]|nr:O-antigen ligase family protein [Sphingomonas koreensis]
MTDHHRTARPHRRGRRSGSPSTAKPGWRVWVSGTLLTVAIVFGGGGTPSPTPELVVELAATVAIVVWAWLTGRDRQYPSPKVDRPLFVMAGIFVAIPVLQLVPLPPWIWHHLPGRDVEIRALALVDRANGWMPWSESPARTVASALSLIPPIAMLFMVSRLRRRDQTILLAVIAALGLLAGIVGVIQLSSGNANWFRFYTVTEYGFATGFQANRNADADVLLIAAMALAAWVSIDDRIRRSRQLQLVLVVIFCFLTLSVVLTGSRAGVALILVVIVASGAMIANKIMLRNLRTCVVAGLVLAILGATFYSITNNARVERTFDRFDRGAERRPEIWKDTVYAIGQHWPAGSGVGTFQPIFAAAERLEYVRPDFSNRAHNDYLEFVLEVGLVAPVFLLAAAAFLMVRLREMVGDRASRERRATASFVLGCFFVLVLHSLVDYPMRTMSLATIAGVLSGLLVRSERRSDWPHV